MGLADELEKDFEEQKQEDLQCQDAARTFDSVEAIVGALSGGSPPRRIAVDMCLLTKEAFNGGWTLWLTSKELKDVLVEKAPLINALGFDKKAKYVFRLTVWDSKKRPAEAVAVDGLAVGTEILADRVTGLHLFKDKLAQGNTSHIEVAGEILPTVPNDQEQKKTPKRSKRTP